MPEKSAQPEVALEIREIRPTSGHRHDANRNLERQQGADRQHDPGLRYIYLNEPITLAVLRDSLAKIKERQ